MHANVCKHRHRHRHRHRHTHTHRFALSCTLNLSPACVWPDVSSGASLKPSSTTRPASLVFPSLALIHLSTCRSLMIRHTPTHTHTHTQGSTLRFSPRSTCAPK